MTLQTNFSVDNNDIIDGYPPNCIDNKIKIGESRNCPVTKGDKYLVIIAICNGRSDSSRVNILNQEDMFSHSGITRAAIK